MSLAGWHRGGVSEARLRNAVAGRVELPANATEADALAAKTRLALDRLEVAIARGFIRARNRSRWARNIEQDPALWLGLIPV